MTKGSKAIATLWRVGFKGFETYEVKVTVLAIVDGYAMVRMKRDIPFTIEAKRIKPA